MYLFNQYDMEIINVEPQESHGGSMRYTISHKGEKSINDNVSNQLRYEVNAGLTRVDSFRISKKIVKNIVPVYSHY